MLKDKIVLEEMRVVHAKYKNLIELAAYIARFKTEEMERIFADYMKQDLYPPMVIRND